MSKNRLYVPQLRRAFKIRQTNRNMRLAVAFQLDMLKVGQAEDGDDVVAQLESEQKFFDKLIEFPTEVLKLSDVDSEKLEDCDVKDLQSVDTELALRVQGADERTIRESLEAMKKPSQVPSKGSKK